MQRDIFSNAQIPAHDKILAMDEKIRTYRLPEFLLSDAPLPKGHQTQFQRAMLTTIIHASALNITHASIDDDSVSSVLLRLHRAHLLKATQQHPENASKSSFAGSLMPCYRSASAMLAIWSVSYKAVVRQLVEGVLNVRRLTHPPELLW
jgi:hypothetical protein